MTETTTPQVDPSNADTAAAWNGADGAHWAAYADNFDRSVAAYHRPFLDAARIGTRDRVLDIGCGNGQTTRDAARLAVDGAAVGVDLSAPLVENARRLARAEGIRNVTFLLADAQVHRFEPASFDVAISRNGAMFFGDPPVAFANLARALRVGGRLALLVWREMARNEWFTDFLAALLAGRPAPLPPPGAPGPFSLADPERVRALLAGAGFSDIDLMARSEPVWFGVDADAAYRFVSSLGFAQWLLKDLDADARAGALAALRRTLVAHDTGDGVSYDSAAWIVTAVRA